jgi:hypothetical protein
MSDGKWSGGVANRTWQRGTRVTKWPGDTERGPRLYEQLAGERFLCEICGVMHPLAEHRQCRSAAAHPAARL